MKAMIPVALMATACAPAEAPGAPDPLLGPCRTEPLAGMVGRAWANGMRAEILRLSGSRELRVIRPGDMVTMDYRGDRLNVHLTSEGQIERFACG
jgi:hypothetical protein